jgi:glycosyltransferase involved in cell wall biosynthesis
VALDATPLLGERAGVGEFAFHVLHALAAFPELELHAFALTWRGASALEDLVPRGARPARWPMPAGLLRAQWARRAYPAIERWTGTVDVVHGTDAVVPPSRRAARVVTVHDLTPVRFPDLAVRDGRGSPELLRRAVDTGAWVHAPSTFVAAEVVDVLGADPDRVVTVAPGVPTVVAADPSAGRRLAGADRYVLAIGTIEPRKDHAVLVRAFDRVADREPDVRLVVAGADRWAVDTFGAEVRRARHRNRIVRLGWVDEVTRSALLRGASVFAFPARYEGFGFAPLEAMEAGLPVVATRTGALPEVLGDAAMFVVPGDEEAMADALGMVLVDDGLQTRLMKAGRNQVARYSWSSCAAGLSELYARAAAAR